MIENSSVQMRVNKGTIGGEQLHITMFASTHTISDAELVAFALMDLIPMQRIAVELVDNVSTESKKHSKKRNLTR